jgi:hypothetical protein
MLLTDLYKSREDEIITEKWQAEHEAQVSGCRQNTSYIFMATPLWAQYAPCFASRSEPLWLGTTWLLTRVGFVIWPARLSLGIPQCTATAAYMILHVGRVFWTAHNFQGL